MATRPTIGTPGWVATGNIVEPSGSKKTQGWSPNEPLPAQNLNWLLKSESDWLKYLQDLTSGAVVNTSVDYSITVDDEGSVIRINSSSASFTLSLPDPSTFSGKSFFIKDAGGYLSTNHVLVHRYGSEQFEGLSADYLLEANFGDWEIFCDGTNWMLI